MSNTNAPFGFKAAGRIDAVAANFAIQHYPLLYSYNVSIAFGDPVILTSGGVVQVMTAGTGVILGIAQGVEYYDTAQQRKIWLPNWPAPSTALAGSVKIAVYSDPNMEFEVQVGGSTTVGATAADIGDNINFAGQSTANAAGYSQAYVDITTLSPGTTTRPFRIVGLGTSPKNDITAPYDVVRVKLNNAFYSTLAGI